MEKIVVMGAGSWGTALAVLLAEKANNVYLWEYQEDRAKELEKDRENKKYLPGLKFPDNLKITSKVKDLLVGAKYVVFSVPSQVLRSVIQQFSSQITNGMILVNTGKGLEVETKMRLSEVIKDEVLGKFHNNIIVLSGPTHAEEVAKKLPTTIVAAGDFEKASKVQELFSTNYFRVYVSNDLIGVELGGSLKNCIAIAAGIADGMGFGDNTKAAIITRGLAEITRFSKEYGAKEQTFSGLAGMGDLIVTCASKHSRNRHVGEELGKGKSIKQIMNEMFMVAEGVPTIKAAREMAKEKKIIMPIIDALYQVVYKNEEPMELAKILMSRDLKTEFY